MILVCCLNDWLILVGWCLVVYHLWFGLLIECCFIFMFATLEINATGVVSGKDLLKKNRSLLLWSVRKSPGTLCWNQASYFSELAFIYFYFGSSVLLIKRKRWFMWCLPLKQWFGKILSSKIYGYYFDTLYGGVRWKILFQTIGWEKDLSIQNLIENPWMDYGVSRCRYWSAEMENGDVYEKCTLCLCTMTTRR